MRKNKSIVIYHNGQYNSLIFGKSKCLDDCVENFLITTAIKLYPTSITLGDGIVFISPNIPTSSYYTVNVTHNNWKTSKCCPMKHFMH